MDAWVPVVLSIVGTLGTIATLIVTHVLAKRDSTKQLNQQTAVITTQQAAIGQGVSDIREISNGRITASIARQEELAGEVATLRAQLERLTGVPKP